MTFPNLDNTFLASLCLYRKWKGGKWYLRHYVHITSDGGTPTSYGWEETGTVSSSEGWCRYGGKSPMSYVVKSEDYTPPPPFIAGLGGTLIDGKW